VTGFELLLLILLIGAVAFSLAAAVMRDVRCLAAAVGLIALVFLCELVHAM
jgi:hypothetical protein